MTNCVYVCTSGYLCNAFVRQVISLAGLFIWKTKTKLHQCVRNCQEGKRCKALQSITFENIASVTEGVLNKMNLQIHADYGEFYDWN